MCAKMQMQEVPIVLSIDSYERKIVTGRFWRGDGIETSFSGLMQFISLVDNLLAKTQGESEDVRCKRLVRPETPSPAAETARSDEPRRGALATFRLSILFRQNTSWQGVVTWVEGRQEQSFRSFLELAMLLDSALCFADENKNAAETNG